MLIDEPDAKLPRENSSLEKVKLVLHELLRSSNFGSLDDTYFQKFLDFLGHGGDNWDNFYHCGNTLHEFITHALLKCESIENPEASCLLSFTLRLLGLKRIGHASTTLSFDTISTQISTILLRTDLQCDPLVLTALFEMGSRIVHNSLPADYLTSENLRFLEHLDLPNRAVNAVGLRQTIFVSKAAADFLGSLLSCFPKADISKACLSRIIVSMDQSSVVEAMPFLKIIVQTSDQDEKRNGRFSDFIPPTLLQQYVHDVKNFCRQKASFGCTGLPQADALLVLRLFVQTELRSFQNEAISSKTAVLRSLWRTHSQNADEFLKSNAAMNGSTGHDNINDMLLSPFSIHLAGAILQSCPTTSDADNSLLQLRSEIIEALCSPLPCPRVVLSCINAVACSFTLNESALCLRLLSRGLFAAKSTSCYMDILNTVAHILTSSSQLAFSNQISECARSLFSSDAESGSPSLISFLKDLLCSYDNIRIKILALRVLKSLAQFALKEHAKAEEVAHFIPFRELLTDIAKQLLQQLNWEEKDLGLELIVFLLKQGETADFSRECFLSPEILRLIHNQLNASEAALRSSAIDTFAVAIEVFSWQPSIGKQLALNLDGFLHQLLDVLVNDVDVWPRRAVFKLFSQCLRRSPSNPTAQPELNLASIEDKNLCQRFLHAAVRDSDFEIQSMVLSLAVEYASSLSLTEWHAVGLFDLLEQLLSDKLASKTVVALVGRWSQDGSVDVSADCVTRAAICSDEARLAFERLAKITEHFAEMPTENDFDVLLDDMLLALSHKKDELDCYVY